jgi:hypothetical protein
MYRKLIALFVSFALTLAGIQPGVAGMIDKAVHTPGVMDMDDTGVNHMSMHHISMGHMDGMDMPSASGMEHGDHSCCPDHDDQLPCDGDCSAMSWLACAIHCGIAAPVYLSAPEMLVLRQRPVMRAHPGDFTEAISIGVSPPFHPPKLFERV